MGSLLLVLREKFVARLFGTAGKEGDDGDSGGKGRAVKDLFKAVPNGVSEICIHQRQFPPDLADRHVAGSWDTQFCEGGNESRLTFDAPNNILGDN